MNQKEKELFLKSIEPFHLLDESNLKTLTKACKTKVFDKDSLIFDQGDYTHKFLYIVITGKIQIQVVDSQKVERIVGYRYSKDFFGETAFFTNDQYAAAALAVEKTTSLLLPEKEFFEAAFTNYDFSMFFNSLLVKRMNELYQKFTFEDESKTDTPVMRRKVKEIMTAPVVTCYADDSVHEVAKKVGTRVISSVVVIAPQAENEQKPLGIITEKDLVDKVLAQPDCYSALGLNADQIMNDKIIKLTPDAFAYQGFLLMVKHNQKHAVITDTQDVLKGIITLKDIVEHQSSKPLATVAEIESISCFEELEDLRIKIDNVLHTLIHERANADEICGVITEFYDRVTHKVIELSEKQMIAEGKGSPPAEYCFITMGSSGRKEQYARTDQDNALIFDAASADSEKYRKYFMQLGEIIVTGMEKFGFARCKGNVMVNNKEWCRSLDEWYGLVDKFTEHGYEFSKGILQMNIFLDFRYLYGKYSLYYKLKRHVVDKYANSYRALSFIAYEVTLSGYSPVSFWGNIKTRQNKNKQKVVDLKKSGCIHVVDCTRLFCLRHSIEETNTFERIEKLIAKGVFEKYHNDIKEIKNAYEILMNFRIKNAYTNFKKGEKSENEIVLDKLNGHELALIRQSLLMVNRILNITKKSFPGSQDITFR